MRSTPKRVIWWTAAFSLVALAVAFLWALSADRRGRWLHEAAWTNNLSTARLLVWLGTDVNYSTGSGTALHGAAYHGNIPMMNFLLRHGATVD